MRWTVSPICSITWLNCTLANISSLKGRCGPFKSATTSASDPRQISRPIVPAAFFQTASEIEAFHFSHSLLPLGPLDGFRTVRPADIHPKAITQDSIPVNVWIRNEDLARLQVARPSLAARTSRNNSHHWFSCFGKDTVSVVGFRTDVDARSVPERHSLQIQGQTPATIDGSV